MFINTNPMMANRSLPMMSGGGSSMPMMMMALQQQMMMLMMTFMSGMMAGQGGMMMPQSSSFGGLGQAGSPGLDNFLGGGGGGSSSVGSSNAPMTNVDSIKGGTEFGQKLAADAGKNANGPGGYCYKWVAQALGRHGVKVSGASAYMGADQLAKNDKFREVQIDPKDFKKLPPGAVVVWNKGAGHPHGHISIALGDGREASDKIRNQITNYGTSARVFLPK